MTLNDLQTVTINGQGLGSYTEPVYAVEGLDDLVSLRDLIKYILSKLGADDNYVVSGALAGNTLQLNLADASQVTVDLSALAGAATVDTDATLDGDGSPGDPLGLADNAVTAAKIAADAVTTAKILNGNVTLAKIANIATARLLGRSTAGAGVVEEIQIGSGLSLAAGTLSATGGGGGGVIAPYDAGEGFWVVASAAGVTVTEGSQGVYTMTIPNGVYVHTFWKNVTNANELTVGGEAQLSITWTGVSFNTGFDDALLPIISLVDSGGNQRNPGNVSVTVQHTSVAGGTSNTTIANLNGLGVPVRVKGVLI